MQLTESHKHNKSISSLVQQNYDTVCLARSQTIDFSTCSQRMIKQAVPLAAMEVKKILTPSKNLRF